MASDTTSPSESDDTMGSDDDDIDNWLEKHMPTWLIEALRSWREGWSDDAKYQSERAARTKLKRDLKREPISSEDYVGSLREPEARGFHSAAVLITNQDRVLMLFMKTRKAVKLSFPAGKRDRMEENAWECARREAEEETGRQAQLPTTPPLHVAWSNASNAKMVVYLSATNDAELAERIRQLQRPPESTENVLPPEGVLTAVWVPLGLLGSKCFRKHLSYQVKVVMSVIPKLLKAADGAPPERLKLQLLPRTVAPKPADDATGDAASAAAFSESAAGSRLAEDVEADSSEC